MLEYEFLRIMTNYVQIYREFPLPAILCDVHLTMYWSNAPAKRLHQAFSQPDGVVQLLHAYDREELLLNIRTYGSYTLQDVFPLSDIQINLSPLSHNDKLVGILVLVISPQDVPTTENFTDISRSANSLNCGVRFALNEIFSILDSTAFRLDLMNLEWMSNSLDYVGINCYHILRVVGNVAEYAKQQSGQREYDFATVNLFGMLEDLYEVMQAQCEMLDIPLDMELPETDVFVRMDTGAFQQAFFHCIHNSLFFTRPKNKIKIRSRQGKNHVTLFIVDQGTGIPKDVLPHIFRPYFSYNHYGYKGVGLGLPLAQSIVYAHNGKCKVLSKSKKGTLVAIRLPLQNPFSQKLPLAQGVATHTLTDRFSSIYVGLLDAALSPYRNAIKN